MKKLLFLALMLISNFAISNTHTKKYDFTVAQDGSGDFVTVQEAIDAVPDHRKQVTTIFIKKGVYKEKLVLAGSKINVSFIGEDLQQTILTYDDYAQKKNKFGEDIGTSGSSSFYIYGNDFYAENITFQNSSGPVGQAVAVWVAGDHCQFKKCRFLGFQDTLYTYGKGSSQFFEECYIEGTTDFIFGSATVLFKNCEIYCKKGGLFITAASTPDTSKYGYVFMDCKIAGDKGIAYYLGRPWRPYAKVVYIRCGMPEFIRPAGWDFWGKESNKQTAYYAEYQNTGEGFKPKERVEWSHQLSEEEIRQYSIEKILGGWKPVEK